MPIFRAFNQRRLRDCLVIGKIKKNYQKERWCEEKIPNIFQKSPDPHQL